jgi:hypothetical protein
VDVAAFGFALAGKHFDQLLLAVAGDAGDPLDFATAHGERYAVDGDGTGIVACGELGQLKSRFADLASPPHASLRFVHML